MTEHAKVVQAFERYSQKPFGGHPNPFWYMYKKMRSDGWLLQLANPAGKTVLNVGCSYPIDELTYGPLVRKWVAVDPGAETVRLAQAEYEAMRDRIPEDRVESRVMDGMDLAYPDASFDLCVSSSAIEHVPAQASRQQIINEMARVARETVIITVADIDDDQYRAFTEGPEAAEVFGDDYHCHLYTKKELANEMEAAGLQILEYAQYGYRIGYLARKP
ncbi:MAG: class I SAM-dependent methyltransferase [Candidatus Sericytochromatia bacterium]|nr:class I SAM-dependent methyltransferase [Candidatus Sericytochromatia bacterium]